VIESSDDGTTSAVFGWLGSGSVNDVSGLTSPSLDVERCASTATTFSSAIVGTVSVIQTHRTAKVLNYRSSGTVHTSAEARLTSVTIRIRIRIRDPDRHQNLIICSSAHCQPSPKFHANPLGSFCSN